MYKEILNDYFWEIPELIKTQGQGVRGKKDLQYLFCLMFSGNELWIYNNEKIQ